MTRLTVLLCLLSFTLSAQERSHQFRIEMATEGDYNKFRFTDLDYNSADGSFTIYGQLDRGVSILNVKGGKKLSVVSGGTTTMLPAVAVATIKGGQTELKLENINLQTVPNSGFEGKPYEATQLGTQKTIGTDKTDKPMSELQAAYPRSFPKAPKTEEFHNVSVDPSMSGVMVRITTTPYTLDGVASIPTADKQTSKIFKVALPEFDGKYIGDVQILKDNKRKLLTMSVGAAKKGDGKFSNMINKKIITVDSQEKITNSFDVTFAFPRALMFAQPLGRSAADTVSSYEQGGLFIYGRVFGGGKNNDPDPTNYEYVMVDGNGALVNKGTFKFGTEKRDLSPVYAYKANEKIYVLAKGIGKDNPNYAVLVFDNTGLVETREYPGDVLKGLTAGPYDKGITTNYARSLMVTNHVKLEDGSVLLCGEAYEDATPVGAPFGSPKVFNYMSQIFLLLDAQGNLKSNIVAEKAEDARTGYSYQNLVGTPGGKVLFVGSKKSGDQVSPVMTLVDPASKSATTKALKDDEILTVDGNVVYRYLPEQGEIIFVGEAPVAKPYTVNATVYKLR
jgi:hypothetical protein